MSFAFVALVATASSCAPSSSADDESPAPSSAAEDLLARSIRFHDPTGIWGNRAIELRWDGTDADGRERVAVEIRLDSDAAVFRLSGRYRGHAIEYSTSAEGMHATVDGTTDVPRETYEEMRLHREDGMFWRSYFSFLAGLPMKLRDPGTRIDPDILETDFEGGAVQAIRVTYDAEVGADTWYFYFDPTTAELVGCRFYHDESANDGEFIVFEGLVEGGGLRLPARRSWFVNADGSHLGTDVVRSVAVGR